MNNADTDTETVSPEEEARFQHLGELLQGGTTLGELAGMQPEHYEMLYASATQLYSAARYEDAEKIFNVFNIPKTKINLKDREALSKLYSNIIESANKLLLDLASDKGDYIFQIGYKFLDL
jgi:hypothetical protein